VVFVNDHDVATVNQDAYTPPSLGVASLPADQIRLISAVAAVNPNTIVVLNTTDPVIVQPWVTNPHVRAVLEMWNAGSEGGTATARLLLGQANPSGHTTITWPSLSNDTIWGYNQNRPLYPGDTTGTNPERLNGLPGDPTACASFTPPITPCTTTALTEGIYSGYRFYDKQRLAPQYPFGYGLSYTRFQFSALTLRSGGDGVDATFTVTNTGGRTGTEVAQVYVGPGPRVAGVQQAVRSLRGFQRVTLGPGESSTVTIHLDRRSFQYWNQTQQRWTTLAGERTIWVGNADTPSDLPLHAQVTIG
jgi:beta-glucosidase